MRLESCEIDFANGNIGNYERVWFHDDNNTQWVMIIPVTDDNRIVLIKHYCVGSEQQEIMLPWWYREPEYSLHEIANKELQEEIWMKAEQVTELTNLHILPWYVTTKTMICVAQWLSPAKLQGDELETITLHTLSRDQIIYEIDHGIINDCRTIAALMYWKHKQQH